MSREKALSELLRSLFKAHELRQFVRYNLSPIHPSLPGDTASLARLADDVVDLAQSSGLVGPAFWAALLDERPFRSADIERARVTWESEPVTPVVPLGSQKPPAPPVTPWFTEDELDALFALHRAAGLPPQVDTLVASLDAESQALLPAPAATPEARVMGALTALNRVRNVTSGQVPLRRWLKTAQTLVGPGPHADRLAKDLAVFNTAHMPLPPPDATLLDADEAGQLEAIVGEEDLTVEIGYLRQGIEAARSVAKLLVPRYFGGAAQMTGDAPAYGQGTGWLVAPRLLLTNHHVLDARDRRPPPEDPASPADFDLQARNTRVEFDYYVEGADPTLWRGAELVASDPTIDFALLRIAPDDPAMPERPPLRVRKEPMVRPRSPRLKERVNVLQHPEGDPMRVGFRDNFVIEGSDQVLSYLTDTRGGSSGSPVLDHGWGVVALHRGSRRLPEQGRPDLRGFLVKDENYGVPMKRIMDWLKAEAPEAHAEILAAQEAAFPPA